MKADVVVVGAGAAGIFAAWRAASLGAKVILVEKTSRIGTKILISGGGKCNVAHAGPIEEVIRAFRPNEGRFIRPACYRLKNEQIVDMMTSRGLRVYTRDDGRVFPIDQTAKDVVAILREYLDEAGVEIRFDTPVAEILSEGGKVVGIQTGSSIPRHTGYQKAPVASYGAKALLNQVLSADETRVEQRLPERIECDRVILATGGSSYPNSGTTGDGWPWAVMLGHRVVKTRAALAPIYLGAWAERSGVALRSVVLRARQAGKEVAKWQGDLLFTHQGISGPAALGISRIVTERQDAGEVTLEIDLIPDQTFEQLTETLIKYGSQHPKRSIATYLEEVMPERLVKDLLESANVAPTVPFYQLEKKARNRITTCLKGWQLGPVRTVPLEKGEVVAGGVDLDEVDPQSMRSKLVQGLYLCGEILDVAGPVGGYNLQSAFATGYVAGESAAKDAGF